MLSFFCKRGSGEQVEKVCSLDGASAGDPQAPGSPVPGLGSQMWSVVWAPEDDARLVTLVDNHLYYWDVQAAGKSAKVVKKHVFYSNICLLMTELNKFMYHIPYGYVQFMHDSKESYFHF